MYTPADLTHHSCGVRPTPQVYGERYVHQMGVVGYFPSNYINETHVFQKNTVEIPTTVSI